MQNKQFLEIEVEQRLPGTMGRGSGDLVFSGLREFLFAVMKALEMDGGNIWIML